MPRKNNSVNMYGKSWGPIDEQNLKNAIKLMEQLNKLAENFAGSLSGVNKITNQINEASRLKNELDKVGVKLNKEQAENVLKALNAKKQQNTESKKYNDLNDVIDSVNNKYNSRTSTRLTSSNFGSTIMGAVQQKEARNILQQQLKQGLANAGQKDIKSGKVLDVAYKETADKLNESAGKYSKWTGVLQIAADTFMSAVKTFGGMFTEGKNKQVNTYENTFTGIAARTGYSRSEYYTQQAQTNNQLGDLGLRDNIRTSEVQQMWSTLTSEGLSIEDSIANAFDTVISSKVVPYLNTSTAQFQFLVDQQPNLMTQVRGIGRTTMEISGSATFATKYLQDMIDTIAPMASLAENELGLQFAQVSGAYESLRAQGLNDAQIGEMYKASASVYNNPYQALKSGSLDEKMAVANVIQTGGDLRDFSDVNTAMMSSQNFVANLVPEGNLSPLYSGLLVSEGKLSGTTALGVALNEGNYDMEQAIKDGIKASDMVDEMGNKVTEEFRNGDYQTNKERQAITMENLSNELATMQQFMGGWYDVIVTAIKGIGTLLTGWLGGKFINLLTGGKLGTWLGGMFKSSGTAAAAAGKLTGASGILAATGGIALGLSAANVIKGAIDNAQSKTDKENITAEQQALEGTAMEGNTAAETLGGIATTLQAENNNFGTNLGATFSDVTGWIGIGTLGWTRSLAAINQDDFNHFRHKVQTLGGGPTKDAAKDALMVWTLLLASANRLSDVPELASITKSDLADMVKDTGIAPSQWDNYLNSTIKDIGYLPNKTKKEDQTSIDWSGLGINYYRQGLDYVPEDNYPALLHQGEAVLTASTANELRTLVDEYRNTNKESISFETIIQNQTSSLISKMDEMLQFMRSQSSATTTDWRNGFITNSMKYVKSTKSFS